MSVPRAPEETCTLDLEDKSLQSLKYVDPYSMTKIHALEDPNPTSCLSGLVRMSYTRSGTPFLFDDIGKLMLCKLPLDTILGVKHKNYQYNKVLLANSHPQGYC